MHSITEEQALKLDNTMYWDFSRALSTANLTYKVGDELRFKNIDYEVKKADRTKEGWIIYVDPVKDKV